MLVERFFARLLCFLAISLAKILFYQAALVVPININLTIP
tara:strand:- start:3159 stop:3278 length:120 start_codon:yes stop_codon:yes gene_type:complete